MPTKEIIEQLEEQKRLCAEELVRLTSALEALRGTRKRPGRPPKNSNTPMAPTKERVAQVLKNHKPMSLSEVVRATGGARSTVMSALVTNKGKMFKKIGGAWALK